MTYYESIMATFVKSKGHLGFSLDGTMEFHERGADIYRAPIGTVIDIDTGYRIARWFGPKWQWDSLNQADTFIAS